MKKWIYRIVFVVSLCVFGYSAYNLWDIYSQKQQVATQTKQLEKKVIKKKRENKVEKNVLEPDWAALQAENQNIVGWIYVPDCDISFPVMQSKDNEYYLNHTVSGEYNNRGSIFLDANANAQFQDDNSIIYGHSVEGGGMFTLLKKYCDEDFFKSHPVFYLLTPDANYNCHVFTFAKTTDDSVFYTTSFGDYRQETLDSMKESSTYFNDLVNTDQKFVSLSTCDLDYGFESSHRFVLTGQLEKTSDDIVLKDWYMIYLVRFLIWKFVLWQEEQGVIFIQL